MQAVTESSEIDRKIRESGCFALVNLEGTLVWFFPRGRLPAYLTAWLGADNGRRLILLRDFLISQARLGPGIDYDNPHGHARRFP
jgi:hypothetical protein